jgi:hypothetical protein
VPLVEAVSLTIGRPEILSGWVSTSLVKVSTSGRLDTAR